MRGHQAWAVLARLLTDDRPVSRRRLAGELFGEAEDPLGALRWCLAQLRRQLGPGTLVGDPIEHRLPEGTRLDIREMEDDDFDPVAAGEFLEGIEPNASAAFNTWLLIERERFRARMRDAARRKAIARLSEGDHASAIDLANVCIRFDPFDEPGHVLLVKALAMAGRHDAAEAHVEATEASFRAELGEAPSDALRSAARRTISAPPLGISTGTVVESQIAAGKAALTAGAIDAGLDCFRHAAAAGQKAGDRRLEAAALLELGTALVHTTRGYDDEGAVILRQSFEAARAAGDASIASGALRELGYVDALAGRRPSAKATLDEAADHACGDPDALAGIYSVMGFNLVDWGKPEAGLAYYEQAIEKARSGGNRRKEAWALGVGAWGHVQAGDRDGAMDWLTRGLALCQSLQWISLMPLLQAMMIEVQIPDRPTVEAKADAERVFAASCQMGDPCWEAAGARVLALCAEAEGDADAACGWMTEAERRGHRVTDSWVGMNVAILADRVRLSRQSDPAADTDQLTRRLVEAAARTHADLHLKKALEFLA